MNKWIKPCNKMFIICSTLAVANSLFMIIYAAVLQRIIDGLNTGRILGEIMALTTIIVTHVLVFFLYKWSGNRLNANLYANNRKKLVYKLHQIPLESLDKLGIGHMLSLYNDDLRKVSDFIGKQLPLIFADIGFLISAYIYFILSSWVTALVVLVVSIGLLPFFKIVSRQIKTHGQKRQIALDQTMNMEENIVRGMLDIQINNAGSWFGNRFGQVAKEYADADFSFIKAQAKNRFLLGLQYNVGLLVVLLMCGVSLSQGRLSLGSVIAVYALYARFSSGIRKISNYIAAYVALKNNLERLEQFDQIDNEKRLTAEPDELLPLTVYNLSYRYNNDQQALDAVDLELREGDRIAIVGGSGCGKSTLAKLLCGYSQRYDGSISFNSAQCRDLDPVKLRRRILYVSNDLYLISEVITTMIRQADAKSLAVWVELLELSHIVYPYIRSQASIQDNAANISGGERQRLILLLSLLCDADVYIFDEMLSSIQRALANKVYAEVNRMKKAAIIWITHQMDLLPMSTQVIYMASGKTVLRGTHDQLLVKSDQYRRFVFTVGKEEDPA
ncbi:MAG: ABC transporter ATP-binding protein [Bacillota bacterium]|nr:ABC transporter ATP-binding protein [Bacillota bacterium]